MKNGEVKMPKNKPYPRPFPTRKKTTTKTPKKKTSSRSRKGLVVPSKKIGKGMTGGKKRSPYKRK